MGMTVQQYKSMLKGATVKIIEGRKDLQKEAIWTKFVEKINSDQYKTVMIELENTSMLSVQPEDAPPGELAFYEGYAQAFTQRMFSGMIDISEMVREFSRTELVAERGAQLNLAAQKTPEYIFHSYLELGDTALASIPKAGGRPLINSIGADGKTLFATDHVWKSGDQTNNTYSNKAAAYADPTESAINTFYTQIRRWTDNTGAPLDLNITDLIIPPNHVGLATKTTQSQYEPDTPNNAVNIAPKFIKGKVIPSQWLASTTDWYINTDADSRSKIMCLTAWMDRTTQGKNPRTGNDMIKISSCWADGAVRLRMLKVTS